MNFWFYYFLCLSVQNWPKRGKFVTGVERKKMITSAVNKSESNVEVGKVLWKLHISWICSCLYCWQGLIMAHGVSRNSVESMELVI